MELCVEMFHNLPSVNSGFLTSSWQLSRNIPSPQMPAKDISTPSSFARPQSGATPRPQHRCPSPPRVLLKLSSPHYQSSNTFHNGSLIAVSSKSECKHQPSPSISPKSLIKSGPNIPVAHTTSRKKRLYGVATSNKALIQKLSSPCLYHLKSPVAPPDPVGTFLNTPERMSILHKQVI